MTVSDSLLDEHIDFSNEDEYGKFRPTRTLTLEKCGVLGARLTVDVCHGDLVMSVDLPVSIIAPLTEALLECQRQIQEELKR